MQNYNLVYCPSEKVEERLAESHLALLSSP